MSKKISKEIYSFAKEIFPIHRSITGRGLRETLLKIKNVNPYLKIKSLSSNKKVFDWKIPPEWLINEAYIIDPSGKKICDFKKNNLHVMSYSIPVNKTISLTNLKKHLYSLPKIPNAIPYVTSYYKRRWGFCLQHKLKKNLINGIYKVKIESKLFKGKLNYGEIILKGKSKKEVFLSTYICHPSLANNEVSGPSLLTYLAKWLYKKKRYYTYRIVFIPETIGSIAYLSLKKNQLKKRVIAGYNITCVGDNRRYSFLPSKKGDTLSDNVAKFIFKKEKIKFYNYKWKNRGSDERQYCSQGINLPIASVMRSKYATYKEYHTSLDNLKNVVNQKGFEGSFKIYKKIINLIEDARFPKMKNFCEPQLSKVNLYPSLSSKINWDKNLNNILDVISYSDGTKSLIGISEKVNISINDTKKIVALLKKKKLLIIQKEPLELK